MFYRQKVDVLLLKSLLFLFLLPAFPSFSSFLGFSEKMACQ